MWVTEAGADVGDLLAAAAGLPLSEDAKIIHSKPTPRVGGLAVAGDHQPALAREADGGGAHLAELAAPGLRIHGAGRLLRRDRLARRQGRQEFEDDGLGVAGHQPPRFRVSRAMITCWIWLVPS